VGTAGIGGSAGAIGAIIQGGQPAGTASFGPPALTGEKEPLPGRLDVKVEDGGSKDGEESNELGPPE